MRTLQARRRIATLLIGCALVGGTAGCRTTAAPAPTAGGGESLELLHAVLWAQTSAEHEMIGASAYHWARVGLDASLEPANRSVSAALEQSGDPSGLPPAVIVDVDDTVLDTSPFQARTIAVGGYDPEAWRAWVREANAEPMPFALEFLREADRRGVRVFYVTNRMAEVEPSTLRNLRERGFPVDADGGNILSQDEREDWGSDKGTRRAFVASGHRVLLIVGDDLNDFVSGARTDPEKRLELARRYRARWGTRWILIPNALYGGWERSLYDFESGLPRDEVLRRKREALEMSP